MNSVVHFEIHATDPEKLVEFYKAVFGWDIKKWEGGQMEYWMVMTAAKDAPNAINGGLVRRKGPPPLVGSAVNAYVCTFQVDDLDEIMLQAQKHGAAVAVPKMALTGMAWMSYMLDPDKNLFGLHQPDVNAK